MRRKEDDEEVEVEECGELEEEEGGAGQQTAPPDALPDDEEIERREEHYQRLRRTIGVGTEDDESENAPLGFDPATLDEVQTLWDPLTACELLARVGHFLRIMSQMMEEVGYMAEILSREHRPGSDPEHDATNLMQGMKRHLSAGDRRRSSGGGMETGGGDEEETVEMPSSSTSAARTTTRRTTRHDPVAREENLTEEDWAIMRAVERCPVWKTIKSFNLREREKLLAAIEKLLAAICMILQETVEGNTEKSTINTVEDFRNWARRWGEDDDHAQLTLQNQWDNLLRHLMGITAAMEVWGPTNVTDPGENSVGNGTCCTPCLQGNSGGLHARHDSRSRPGRG